MSFTTLTQFSIPSILCQHGNKIHQLWQWFPLVHSKNDTVHIASWMLSNVGSYLQDGFASIHIRHLGSEKNKLLDEYKWIWWWVRWELGFPTATSRCHQLIGSSPAGLIMSCMTITLVPSSHPPAMPGKWYMEYTLQAAALLPSSVCAASVQASHLTPSLAWNPLSPSAHLHRGLSWQKIWRWWDWLPC